MGRAIARDGPAAPLIDTVAALWPEAEVRIVRRHVPHRDLLAELALMPSASPRTAVPVVPAAAAAGSLRRASAATGPREAVARFAAARVVRVGGVRALADRVEVRGSARNSLMSYLEQALGRPVTFSVGIGTDRVNRKPVLEVFDSGGRALGFVKVGLGPVAREDVYAETAALQRLSVLDGTGIHVPRVIHAGRWRDAPVLVMGRVPTPGVLLDWDRLRVPGVWMKEFDQRFREPSRRLSDLPWWAGVVGHLASLACDEARDTALTCAEHVSAAATAPLAVSSWHGDWTPWNMARHRRGLSLWDWERFETGVPAGLDLVHYLVNVQTVTEGTTPAAVAKGMARAARHHRRSRRESDVLAGIYLAAITSRYLRFAAGPGGEAIAVRADCFLAAWQDWSRRR